jgi:putative colanic acid biosynthesis UDP-glucose lipid carrier transferase
MSVSNRQARLPRSTDLGGARPVAGHAGLLGLAAAAVDLTLCVFTTLLLNNACGAGAACARLHDQADRIGLVAGLLFVCFGVGSRCYARAALLRPPFALLVGNWLKTLALVGVSGAFLMTDAALLAPTAALLGFLGLMALLAGRELMALVLALAYRNRVLSPLRTLVLARSQDDAEALARRIDGEEECRPVACLPHDAGDALLETLRQGGVDRVVVQTGGIAREEVANLLQRLRAFPTPAHFLAGAPRLGAFQRPADEIGALPVFAVKRRPLSRLERAGKRAFDLGVASAALFLLAPLLLGTSLALRFSGAPRILVRRSCTGFDGRAIHLLSFASLDDAADGTAATPGLMQRTGLAGLPGLLNVIGGDLSLVGPRPLPAGAGEPDMAVARFAALQGLKPGLAHDFVVESPLGGPRRRPDRQRLRLDDLAYLDQWSFGLDLAVLAASLGRHCIVRARHGA